MTDRKSKYQVVYLPISESDNLTTLTKNELLKLKKLARNQNLTLGKYIAFLIKEFLLQGGN